MNKKFNLEPGTIIYENKFGAIKIIKFCNYNSKGEAYYEIEFLQLNMYGFNTRRIISRSAITHYKVQDIYQPSVCGVGCIGNAYTKINNIETKEHILWKSIMSRCYNKNHKAYNNYGGAGIKMCYRWLCFEYFCQDLPMIPGYNLWVQYGGQIYVLDKDILQRNTPINKKIYSLETCIFILRRDNALESRIRNDISNSGYIGVRVLPSGNYTVEIGDFFGTYDNVIAAASLYNIIARNRNYPIEYLNQLPYEMSREEIIKHRVIGNYKNTNKIMCYTLK